MELLARYRNKMFRLACFVLLILFSLTSCGRKNEIGLQKSVGLIPPIYKRAQDEGFSKSQDTLFYHRQYFSGHIFDCYPNLDTAFDISFLSGVQEGLTKKWYPNKKLAEERLYIKGKKEGIHKAWWEDGKPKFIFEVTDDVYCGELKEWYSSGQLAKNFHYVNGQEEGTQQLWWNNGKLRANYVVHQGRKYGSIGVKLCLNPNDSIYKK